MGLAGMWAALQAKLKVIVQCESTMAFIVLWFVDLNYNMIIDIVSILGSKLKGTECN